MNRKILFYIIGSILLTIEISFPKDKAVEWLEQGINSNDPQQKIQCFLRSIELNPQLIEAHYNLGLTYYSIEEFNEAKSAFDRALRESPDNIDNSVKSKIIFELGKTYTKLGNYDYAREAFLFVKNVAQDTKIKSVVLYELSKINLKSEQYDQAISNLNEGINLNPPNISSFQTAIRLANRLKLIDTNYNEGIKHFQNNEYEKAVNSLSEVIKEDPKFKDAAEKLAQARAKLIQQKEQRSLHHEKSDSQKTNVPQISTKLKPPKEEITINGSELDNLQQLYDQGLAAIKIDNWREAINCFKHVKEVNPNYRDINSRLMEAKLGMESAKEMEEVAKFYNQAITKFNNGEWLESILDFERAKMLYPGYKDIELKIAEAKQHLQQAKENNRTNFFSEGKPSNSDKKNTNWTLIGVIFSVLLIPTASYLLLSPAARARYYLLKGKYSHACRLYEHILTKKPEKTKVYITLANIYLDKNRHDDKALKVYQTALQSNIDSAKKRKIKSIIAEEFLKKNIINQNSVNILEEALKNEMNGLKKSEQR